MDKKRDKLFTFDLKGSFYNRRVAHRLNLSGAEAELGQRASGYFTRLYETVESHNASEYLALRQKASTHFRRMRTAQEREDQFFNTLSPCSKCLQDLNSLDL